MKRPIYMQQAARLLRARLDRTHPGFAGSEVIADALNAMGPYLDSYVFPLLDVLGSDERPVNWVRDMLARDCGHLTLRERGAAKVRELPTECSKCGPSCQCDIAWNE